MIDIVKHKGYYGVIDYCVEDKIYFVVVVGIGNSSISCHGETLDKAKEEFIDSVEFHLEVSKAEGWPPCITDPAVAREMEALLNAKNSGNFQNAANFKDLAVAV